MYLFIFSIVGLFVGTYTLIPIYSLVPIRIGTYLHIYIAYNLYRTHLYTREKRTYIYIYIYIICIRIYGTGGKKKQNINRVFRIHTQARDSPPPHWPPATTPQRSVGKRYIRVICSESSSVLHPNSYFTAYYIILSYICYLCTSKSPDIISSR